MLKEGLFKKMVYYISFSIAIGFLILLILTPLATFNSTSDVIAVYRYWFIASFIMGVTDIIYEFENISLLVASVVHILITIIIIFATMVLTAKFYVGLNISIFSFAMQAVIIGIVIFGGIWIFYYLVERREAKKINNKLK